MEGKRRIADEIAVEALQIDCFGRLDMPVESFVRIMGFVNANSVILGESSEAIY